MGFPKLGNLAPTFTLPNQRGERSPSRTSAISIRWCCIFTQGDDAGLYGPGLRHPRPARRVCRARGRGARHQSGPGEPARELAERDALDFDLLSDADHAVAERYGVWGLKKFMGREFMGIRRTTFIIGRDGRLRHVMDKIKTASHQDDVLAWLRQNPD